MRSVSLGVLILLGLLTGCASTGSAAHDGKPHADCLVCKKNADLACVDIPVDADTPRFTYAGSDYYFCSDECKKAFASNPRRYAPSK